MEAASSLDNIPRCYLPDRDLNHFPPLWFLGILVTYDDLWNFAQIHNLVPPCATPSDEDRVHANDSVTVFLGEMFHSPRYTAKIEFVHDNTRTSQYCVFICSNYTLAEMEDCLLKLWDFIQPPQTVAWYLDAAADPSPQRGERADWLLDCEPLFCCHSSPYEYRSVVDLVWETKYAAKTRSSSSIIPA